MQEKIVEIKICKHCNSNFEITDKDLEFYEKVSPIFVGKKYNIPAPTLCPDCRQQRRLSFRNERKLYKRKCDATGKGIISIYSPDKLYKVYDNDYWWSDKWDPMDYGFDFDFNRSFFEQFDELMGKVPTVNLMKFGSENCDYTNQTINCKDGYLLFSSLESNNCMYGRNIRFGENVVDSLQILNSSNLYETSVTKNSYNLYFSYGCINSNNSTFLYRCVGCSFCFGCSNLLNKQYCLFNKQLSKEDYIKQLNLINLGSYAQYSSLKTKFQEILLQIPRENLILLENEGECGVDFIRSSSNSRESWHIVACQDVKFGFELEGVYESYDVDMAGNGCSMLYESCSTGIDSSSSAFSYNITGCSKQFYSYNCFDSYSLFACIGLRNKSFCIFNKQYTKEEYEILVPKIIEHMIETGEWGEFFPSNISPFGYNETVAMEYSFLTKEEAIKKGCNRSDYETPFPKVQKIIPANKLPDDIKDIPDDILNRAIECEVTKKPFRIIKQELDFYRKHNLPVPRRYPDQRHLDRMALRNGRKLYNRKCDKCNVDIKTTYAPERKEIVYCEKCYNKEVYG